PWGFGLRQSSAAFSCGARSQRGPRTAAVQDAGDVAIQRSCRRVRRASRSAMSLTARWVLATPSAPPAYVFRRIPRSVFRLLTSAATLSLALAPLGSPPGPRLQQVGRTIRENFNASIAVGSRPSTLSSAATDEGRRRSLCLDVRRCAAWGGLNRSARREQSLPRSTVASVASG